MLKQLVRPARGLGLLVACAPTFVLLVPLVSDFGLLRQLFLLPALGAAGSSHVGGHEGRPV